MVSNESCENNAIDDENEGDDPLNELRTPTMKHADSQFCQITLQLKRKIGMQTQVETKFSILHRVKINTQSHL